MYDRETMKHDKADDLSAPFLLLTLKDPPDDSMRAPQFTKKLTDLTINDGEQLELTAKVDGDPEPQVTWSKNGKVKKNAPKRIKILLNNAY